MPDHAGFAAAVTVREHVLNTALLAAYANGRFSTSLRAGLPGGPPAVATDLFLGLPVINCEGATGLLVLTVSAWGGLHVTVDGTDHDVRVAGELEVALPPAFGPGSSLRLEPDAQDVVVRRWTASVTSPGTPADVVAYVVGEQFRQRLQEAVQGAIAFRVLTLPSIDVSFFGPLAPLVTSVDARVRNGVLLLGLNVDNDTDTIVGDPEALVDFARSNDVAGVVNAAATVLLLDDLHTRMLTAVEDDGASLDRFAVTPVAGYFHVRGAASKSSGTVNFSFRVVPSMFHTRPGTTFRFLPKTRWVNSRTWAALGFHIEGVDTDVDRSWWVVVLDVFLGILTLGFATIYIEGLVSAAGESFSGRVQAASPGAPSARVQRSIPPPGGVGVRIGFDQFEISADGTYIGISVRPTPTPGVLLGPTTVPSTYAGDALRYLVRLPSAVFASDPGLRVRWTLEDRTNGVVVADEDRAVTGPVSFDVTPAALPGIADFAVVARLYRRLGPTVTELGTESVNVHLRGPLPAGAYVRWRSEVKNPQVSVDEATDIWNYRGEVQVRRWSEWHRTDAPCRSVNASARYRYQVETADRLPFPLKLLESHRKGLCPYCFFGGPAGVNLNL